MPLGTTVRAALGEAANRETIAARVNGKLIDLSRPLDEDATLEAVASRQRRMASMCCAIRPPI